MSPEITQTSNSTTVANADGSFTADISQGPVNFLNSSGKWEQIDNSLVPASGDTYSASNAANGYDLDIPTQPDEDAIRFAVDDEWLKMRMHGLGPSPADIDGAEATFEDVAHADSVIYEATDSGVKESIVLDAPPAQPVVYRYDLSTSPGYSPRVAADQSIRFTNSSGVEAPFFIPAGVMTDSNRSGQASSADVRYALLKVDGRWTLTVSPSSDWLMNPNRVYPVIVDPSVEVRDINPPKDCWMQEDAPNTSRCNNAMVWAGRAPGARRRGLLDFRLDAIPAGARISAADLFLWLDASKTTGGGGSADYGLWQPGRDWSQAATWNNSGTGYGWAAGDIGQRRSNLVAMNGGTSGWKQWDVREFVLPWQAGTLPNRGMALAQNGESVNKQLAFVGQSQNNGLKPILRITYVPDSPPNSPSRPSIANQQPNGYAPMSPEIFTAATDPDGGELRVDFFIVDTTTGAVAYSQASGYKPSGSSFGAQVPAAYLVEGRRYQAVVYANDRYMYGSPSESNFFVPYTSPVVRQILDSSAPGTTAAQVTSIINSMVAGSGEDGSAPLSFDQAGQELLNALTDSLQVTTSTPTSATNNCQWSIRTDGTTLIADRDGSSTTLTKQPGGDALSPQFEGTVNGNSLRVTVWRGASASSIAADLASGEQHVPALQQASVDNAVDGEVDTEVNETLSGLPEPTGLETIGYRLEVTDAVEDGVPDPNLTQGGMARGGAGTSSACSRGVASSTSAEGTSVATPQGKMFFPSTASTTTTESSGGTAARSYGSDTSVVRYRTFIPMAQASTKWVCGTFLGDNRNFTSYYDAGNRTRASVFFNWTPRTIDTSKHVGTTHRIAAYGRSAKAKTASSDGIKFYSASISDNYGRINVVHSVGNPLCAFAGAITYNVIIEVWKNGAARISGTRVKVPNHEAYLYPTSGSYGQTIMQKQTSHFYCLSINCGQETIDSSTE